MKLALLKRKQTVLEKQQTMLKMIKEDKVTVEDMQSSMVMNLWTYNY